MGCGASTQQQQVPNENRDPGVTSVRAPRAQDSGNGRAAGGNAASMPKLGDCPPWEIDCVVTKHSLATKRTEFWHTRVTNILEVWQTLHVACDAILEGNHDLAQTMIDASGLRLRNGSLDCVYDHRGNEYKIPKFCYSNPTNILTAQTSSKNEQMEDPAASTGGGVPIKIKLRLANHFGRDVLLDVQSLDPVKLIKQALQTESERIYESTEEADVNFNTVLPADKQRFYYQGREIKDSETPFSFGLQKNWVVTVIMKR